MADQFGSNVEPLLPTNERYERFKKQQAAVMQQHQQFAQQLEQKQAQVNARKGDLDIAGRMMKVLDSRVPKPARQFLARELAQHVGADPKSEQVKNVTGMLTALDPDSLQGLRTTFASQLDGAPPGQIAQTIGGVLTGKVSMDDFMGQVSAAQQSMSGDAGQEELLGGEASDVPVGDEVAGEAKKEDRLTQDQPTAAPSGGQLAPYQPGAEGEIRSLEGQRTISPIDQPVSPGIVGALGLDSTNQYRHRDLTQGGFKVPFDHKAQEELATEINTRTTGLSATINEATKMVDIFEFHPETLGTVGAGAQTIQTIIQQTRGALALIRPGATDATDPFDAKIQGLARDAGVKIAQMHGIEVTATNAAQIESMAIGLAYKMAIANDIPGNRLTNVIIEQNLRQIGQSGDPKQFKAVLANTIDSTTREFNESIRRKTGANGTDIMARQMSDADLTAMATRAKADSDGVAKDPSNVELLPRPLRESMLKELQRRKSGAPGATLTPSSPTIQEEQGTLGRAEMEAKGLKRQETSQTMRIQQQAADRAVRTEERQDTREERLTRASEATAKIERERFESQKAEQARDNAFQRERFDYQKQQDRIAADKQRADKIAAAFRSFGAAIAGSRGGGGSVGVPNLGGGQDVSAFRMNPAPQRTPPRPGGNR